MSGPPVDPSLKWMALGLLLVQNAITPIVFRYATTEASLADKFDTSVAVSAQEFIKLVLSLVLYLREVGWDFPTWVAGLKADIVEQPVTTLKLGVPAFLYFVQNSSLQIGSANLPAAVFQLLYQGKTLVVAICSVLMLNKVLTRGKWFALLIMSLGIGTVQLGSGKESKQSEMGNSADQSVPLGLFVVLVGCLCSGVSGVYFEMMMKPQPLADGSMPKSASMWIRNVQLAFFSLVIGAVQVAMMGSTSDRASSSGLLHGFTPKVWGMVLNNAVGGLLVAMVIKYADNLMKGFASALATVCATFMSVPLFGFEIGFVFMVGVFMVVYSTLLYGGQAKLPAETLPDGTTHWDKEFEACAALRRGSNNAAPSKEGEEPAIVETLLTAEGVSKVPTDESPKDIPGKNAFCEDSSGEKVV